MLIRSPSKKEDRQEDRKQEGDPEMRSTGRGHQLSLELSSAICVGFLENLEILCRSFKENGENHKEGYFLRKRLKLEGLFCSKIRTTHIEGRPR